MNVYNGNKDPHTQKPLTDIDRKRLEVYYQGLCAYPRATRALVRDALAECMRSEEMKKDKAAMAWALSHAEDFEPFFWASRADAEKVLSPPENLVIRHYAFVHEYANGIWAFLADRQRGFFAAPSFNSLVDVLSLKRHMYLPKIEEARGGPAPSRGNRTKYKPINEDISHFFSFFLCAGSWLLRQCSIPSTKDSWTFAVSFLGPRSDAEWKELVRSEQDKILDLETPTTTEEWQERVQNLRNKVRSLEEEIKKNKTT